MNVDVFFGTIVASRPTIGRLVPCVADRQPLTERPDRLGGSGQHIVHTGDFFKKKVN